MSAEHAHSAEHHEAHGHGHHGPNAMHFNNGGVLGIAEAIGRLAKGVTYDAAVDTFGGAHGGHAEHGAHAEHGGHADHADHADHAHPAPAAHADAAHGDAHGAGHEHGGHGALATAATVGHAIMAAHDEHKDPFDKVIDGIAHLNHIHPMFGGRLGAAFPFIARGAKWIKEKLYPTIHEISVDDQHIGDQILHKLKKDKKAAKEGKTQLDHHALEGFCMGIDIANLQRTFRMFVDKTRFETALNTPNGREEIRKEMANILDLSGEIDRKEVEQQTKMLLELLGDHVDSRVHKQHHALIHIIKHVEEWLTPGVLRKVFESGEKNFKIDFEHFGDLLLEEVNPDNAHRYLAAINEKTFQSTFKSKFPYLTHEGSLLLALKKDSEKEKVLKQLQQFTGVDYAMDLAALKDHIAVLKSQLGEKPSDSTKPYFKEYEVFVNALDMVAKTMANTGALAHLFIDQKPEDAKKPIDYANIGLEIFRRIKKKEDLAAFEKQLDVDELLIAFGSVIDEDSLKAEVQANKEGLKNLLCNLFGIKGALTLKRVEDQAATLNALLVQQPRSSIPNCYMLANFINDVKDWIKSNKIIENHYSNQPDESPFEINYSQFANEIFTRVKKPLDQKRFLLGFDRLEFEAAFSIFFPKAEIKNRIKSPEGKKQVKEQIGRLFYPLSVAPGKVSHEDLKQQIRLILLKLGGRKVEKSLFDEVVKALDVKDAIVPLLDEIYSDEPEVIQVQASHFGSIIKNEVNSKETAISFLRGYKPAQVRDYLSVLADGAAFDAIVAAGGVDVNKLQERVRAFAGMDLGPVTPGYLTQMKTDFVNALNLVEPATLPPDLKAKYDHMVTLLADVVTTLSAGKRLEKLFNPETGINYEELGSQISNLNADQIIPFLKEMKIAKVGEIYGVLGHPKTFEAIRTKDQREELRAKIEGLFGISPLTVPSNASLRQRAQELLQTLGSHPSISLVYQAQLNLNQLQTKFSMYVNMLGDEQLENIYKGVGRKKTT